MRIFIAILSFFSFVSVSIYSLDETEIAGLMQQAMTFEEAKNPGAAKEIYQSLLQEPLPEWKRSILLYNLGTTLLAVQEWDQAVTVLKTIAIDRDNPVLNYRVSYNLALAYLRSGIAKKSQDLATAQLNLSLNEIAEAEEANCLIQKLKGLQECQSDPALEEMKQIAKEYLERAKSRSDWEQEPSEKQPEQETAATKMSPEVDAVLNTLFQMEQEDENLKPAQEIPKSNVVRPW